MGASWSYIVLDFLLHAVVLAPWWRATQAFWLPPLELAKRIPFAYGAFVIYCASLTVLLTVVRGEQPLVLTGLRFGAFVGIVFGVTSALGAYSVVEMPISFLLVGPGTTAIGSAGAGAAAAWILSGRPKVAEGWRSVCSWAGVVRTRSGCSERATHSANGVRRKGGGSHEDA